MVLSDFCDAFDEAVDRRLHRERHEQAAQGTPGLLPRDAREEVLHQEDEAHCSTASVTKQTSSDGRKLM